MVKVAALVSLLITAVIFPLIAANENSTIANTQQGVYIGEQVTIGGTNVNSWYGIPYAEQPVGNLRWMPPQPLPIYNGSNYAYIPNACPQTNSFGLPLTESCLTLNVYAPASASNLPVFVWIHGGSFTSGAGAFYDATPFVSTSIINSVPVVVVTINYRLGLLGFLADEELYAERSGSNNKSTTGNYGILDQIMAFDWIKKNIAGFGGNPNDITTGGESAGGISVNALLTSPLVTKGTFQKAIVQSGSIWPNAINTLQNAVNSTSVFLRANVTCRTVQCLRNITVDRILAVQNILASQNIFGASASPTIDGYVLTETLEQSYAKGAFQRVPLLIGTTTNETSIFTCPYFNQVANIAQVQAFFVEAYGSAIANEIPNVYGPISSYANPLAYLNTVFSDSWVHCGSRRTATTFSIYELPSYLYTFNHLIPVVFPCLGVAHAAELPMLFPLLLPILHPNYNFSASEQQLSTNMILHWAHFISAANPNYNGAPANWDPYRSSSDDDFVIDVKAYMRYRFYNATCSRFWDQYASENSAINTTSSLMLALFVIIFQFILM